MHRNTLAPESDFGMLLVVLILLFRIQGFGYLLRFQGVGLIMW